MPQMQCLTLHPVSPCLGFCGWVSNGELWFKPRDVVVNSVKGPMVAASQTVIGCCLLAGLCCRSMLSRVVWLLLVTVKPRI